MLSRRESPIAITEWQWDEIVKHYAPNGTCSCCGQVAELTIDHVAPTSLGGYNIVSNVQPLCRECNARKNNYVVTDYRPDRGAYARMIELKAILEVLSYDLGTREFGSLLEMQRGLQVVSQSEEQPARVDQITKYGRVRQFIQDHIEREKRVPSCTEIALSLGVSEAYAGGVRKDWLEECMVSEDM
jgi:hypothetical protein